MRIRRLLFVLAFILLGRAAPVHAALGDAPRCLPAAVAQGTAEIAGVNPPLPALHQSVPNYDSEERDYLIRTIAFEASGEPEEGKAAVAHVILNRKKSGRWGDNIKEVVTHPWQFEPWMTRRKEMQRLSRNDPRYRSAAQIADAVLAGLRPDPTAGATHFLNPTVVRQRRGGSLPAWARGGGQPIGRHTFYSPEGKSAPFDEDKTAPQRATLALSIMASSTSMLTLKASREADSECGRHALTATSPALPAADDLVQLIAR